MPTRNSFRYKPMNQSGGKMIMFRAGIVWDHSFCTIFMEGEEVPSIWAMKQSMKGIKTVSSTLLGSWSICIFIEKGVVHTCVFLVGLLPGPKSRAFISSGESKTSRAALFVPYQMKEPIECRLSIYFLQLFPSSFGHLILDVFEWQSAFKFVALVKVLLFLNLIEQYHLPKICCPNQFLKPKLNFSH